MEIDKLLERTFIIAEIGKNFIQTEESKSVEEYLDNAKELVLEAKEAGADAVKFQTHYVHDEVLNMEFTSPHFTKKVPIDILGFLEIHTQHLFLNSGNH